MKEMKIIPVTIEDKINFVKWCSKNFKSPNREVFFFFNTLLNNTRLLNRVKFVENNFRVSRAITIKAANAVGTYGSPFIYTKDNNPYGTAEKAVNDLFNESSNFYILLDFREKFQTPEFVAVLEDNPFVKTNKDEVTTSTEALKYIDETLIKARADYEKEEWYRLIDKALDKRDEEAFLKLTSKTIL